MLIDSFLGGQVTPVLVELSFAVEAAGRADSAGELGALVARLKARVMKARARLGTAAGLARQVRAGRDPVPEVERRAAVEVLLGVERTLVELGGLVLERAWASQGRAADVAPRLLPLLRQMTGLVEEEIRLHAEAVRDVRRALLAPGATADGRVLAGRAEAGSFLQGVRAAP